MTTADDIGALAAWDTPALSNALDALRLRSFDAGYTDGSVTRVAGNGTMTGRAVTARMVAREPGDDGIPVSRLHQAVPRITAQAALIRQEEQRWSAGPSRPSSACPGCWRCAGSATEARH